MLWVVHRSEFCCSGPQKISELKRKSSYSALVEGLRSLGEEPLGGGLLSRRQLGKAGRQLDVRIGHFCNTITSAIF